MSMESDILDKPEGSLQSEKFAMDSWGNSFVAFSSFYQKIAEELLYFYNVISGSVASETACLFISPR